MEDILCVTGSSREEFKDFCDFIINLANNKSNYSFFELASFHRKQIPEGSNKIIFDIEFSVKFKDAEDTTQEEKSYMIDPSCDKNDLFSVCSIDSVAKILSFISFDDKIVGDESKPVLIIKECSCSFRKIKFKSKDVASYINQMDFVAVLMYAEDLDGIKRQRITADFLRSNSFVGKGTKILEG